MTRRILSRWPAIAAALLLHVATTNPADAQVRVVTYNVLNNPDNSSEDASFTTIFNGIAASGAAGLQRLPDIFAGQEVDTDGATRLVNLLNNITPGTPWAYHYTDSVGGDRQAVFYRADTVTLISSEMVDLRTQGATRPVQHSVFRPVGYTSTDANLHIYSVHLKAGSSDSSQRNLEATLLRQQVAALGNANVIIAGDYNFYGSGESGYQTLIAAGSGHVNDPLNGAWGGAAYTQAPANIDDRFDFQFLTNDLTDSEGVALIAGTYRTFGNNNGSLDGTYGSALLAASDHLPVVADYQLPAQMTVGFGSTPSVVIRDASASIQTTVTNTAPVTAANAADELNYTINGSINGVANAAASGSVHNIALNTATVGAFNAIVNVTTTSQAAQITTPTSTNHAYTVLDHANGSFDANSDLNELTLDFGNVTVGQNENLTGELFNLVATAGYTASLDLDLLELTSGGEPFDVIFAPFAQLTAGSSSDFLAFFNPTTTGSFDATYLLHLSDEDLLGALSQTLTLHLLGVGVVPEPGTLFVLVMLAGPVLGRRVRRSANGHRFLTKDQQA